MDKQLIFPMEEKYEEYVIDESKWKGCADSISFPKNEEEILTILEKIRKESNSGITIQGGKTGIVGGAVPNGGHILNISGMAECKSYELSEDGTAWMTVETGITLMELNKEIDRIFKKQPMIWPPQPTETSATVGGILASGAKGINACYYGDSRQYVKNMRMVLSDGTVREIRRGKDFIRVGEDLTDEMDLILGGEGIFGVVTEAALLLVPKPKNFWGISFFFTSLNDIDRFAKGLDEMEAVKDADIVAMEYMDRAVMDVIEKRKSTMTKLKGLPGIDSRFSGMVYLELAGEEESIEQLAEMLMEMALDSGSDPEAAWAVSGETEIEKMRAFRHAAAETANLFIEEVRRKEDRITKLGTDMMLKDMGLAEVIGMYQEDMKAAGLHGCIFGHMKGNHFHVNILPENYQDYLKGRQMIAAWAERAVSGNGCMASEHGIGKLKAHLLQFALPVEKQDALRLLKEKYDRIGLWNNGNIFPGNIHRREGSNSSKGKGNI